MKTRLAIVATSIAVSAVVEVVLLQRIVFHQAGGWGNPAASFAYVSAWATVPFIWAIVLVVVAVLRKRLVRVSTPLIVLACGGPVMAYVALAQYSHSTPFFMLVGFAIQCIAALVATIRLTMPPNPAAQSDAFRPVLDTPTRSAPSRER